MSIRKMKYIIKSCSADDTQGLQNLLNEMSMNGWELYSMNEVENDDKIMFNCIFMMEDNDVKVDDTTDIMSWGTVKNPIEKMLSPRMTPYEKGLEIISKIKTQKKKIAEIKEALDVEDPSSGKRKKYNDKISSSIKEFENLKTELAEMSNPTEIFSRLGVDILSLFVSEELVPIVDTDSEETENLYPEIIKMRYENADNLGYVIPTVRILDSLNLATNEFVIAVRGSVVFKGVAYPHYRMFFVEDLNLTRKMKGAIYDVDFITGKKIVWISEDKTKDFWKNGLKAAQFITRALDFVVIKYVDEILSYDELDKYCQLVEAQNPFLVENIIPDVISFADLRYVLTSLIRESVSIKDILFIFGKLNDFAETSTKSDLLNKIRLSMTRQICMPYMNDDEIIPVIELSDDTFDKLIPKIEENDDIVKIDAEFAEKLSGKIIKKADSCKMNVPILVVPMEYRQLIFNLLSNYINNIVILAREELGCNFTFEVLAEV